MAIKNSWASGEVLTAADLTDTMKGVYINAQTSTSFTFGTADGFVTLSNASGGTATIPANSTAAFNTGAVIGVMNAGTAGSFTIGTAAGVTLNAVSGTTTLAPLESATLVKLGTNTWQLSKGGGGLPKASVSATTGAPGTVTSGSTTAYVFKGSGSITFDTSGSVEILVVAGGGGGTGGSNNTNFQAPGGGGGGVLYVQQAYVIAGSALTVTVGAGGSASTGVEGATQGNFSSMGSYYAIGGGCGLPGNSLNINGVRIGGSGAGGAGGGAATVSTGASGVTGQGNAGGNGATASTQGGGGGGGAGGVGGNAVTTTGGAGGVGVTSTILASADATAQSVGQVSGGLVYYGGGGGGYGTAANGAAGLGGGGGTTTANGTANTGGGGRGQVGTGGSGVVIVKVG